MKHSTAIRDFIPSAIPPELRNLRQWVGWEYAKGKKRPLDPATGEGASTKDPETWGTFSAADALFERVGFVFNEDDPYCGIDLDHCLDPRTGEVSPAAWEVVRVLNSYTEVSPSGKGLKVWVRATKPGRRCNTKDTPWGEKIEIYDRGRFFAVTGNVVRERPIRDAQGAVDDLYERFLERSREAVVTPLRRRSGGVSLRDDEVIERARDCRKTGARFSELYDHGSSVPRGERSEADWFVCWCLARANFGDAEQVKRLFRLSDLARGKYAEKRHKAEDYLQKTVDNAVRRWELSHDPEFGERMRQRVRELVRDHRERLERSDLTGSKKRVMATMLDVAEEVASLQKRGVEFNVNQYWVAETIGISQKQVSRIIASLRAEGWLVRLSVGNKKKAKNSTYRLPMIVGGLLH